VHLTLVGEVLRRRQRKPGRDDALDGRVVGEVQEERLRFRVRVRFWVKTRARVGF